MVIVLATLEHASASLLASLTVECSATFFAYAAHGVTAGDMERSILGMIGRAQLADFSKIRGHPKFLCVLYQPFFSLVDCPFPSALSTATKKRRLSVLIVRFFCFVSFVSYLLCNIYIYYMGGHDCVWSVNKYSCFIFSHRLTIQQKVNERSAR